MARIPITVMGFRCDQCSYEWIAHDEHEPEVCPKCKSRDWDQPAKLSKKSSSMLTYEDFREKIRTTLTELGSVTWTEIRTAAKLPQAFPNNKWVRKMETDIGLKRVKDAHGIIKWSLD